MVGSEKATRCGGGEGGGGGGALVSVCLNIGWLISFYTLHF